MREITSYPLPDDLNSDESLWLYNALDCLVTLEGWEALQLQRTPASDLSYNFVSAMRAPALAMMEHGIRVDMEARSEAQVYYEKKLLKMQNLLNTLTMAVWGKPLNPNSSKQCIDFFYGCMQIPKIGSYKQGEYKVSMDRDTLEKLEIYLYARPIIRAILLCRDYEGKLEVLTKALTKKGKRFSLTTSYNVVGTKFGRWSSSEDAFHKGTNMQNITDELRRILVPDEGLKFGYLDLEQAESRAVAYISGDLNYITACESGDLHTTVAIMVWPHIKSREDADKLYYRHFSYRDIAKRLGHGTNYYGKPAHMAAILKIPVDIVKDFQDAYFKAFPGIKTWHKNVAHQLQVYGHLTTALGRQIHFLGRRSEDETLREAIACEPQSTVGETLNLYLYRIWSQLKEVQVLAQIHDAVLIQYKKESEDAIIRSCLYLADIHIGFPCGILTIPSSAEVGWNFGKFKKNENPQGLKKWAGNDTREEQRVRRLLDRPIHTIQR